MGDIIHDAFTRVICRIRMCDVYIHVHVHIYMCNVQPNNQYEGYMCDMSHSYV